MSLVHITSKNTSCDLYAGTICDMVLDYSAPDMWYWKPSPVSVQGGVMCSNVHSQTAHPFTEPVAVSV